MRSVVRISKQTLSFVCIVGLLAVCFLPTFAQKPTTQTKRPLTHQDYDSWRSIQAPQISRDGKFVAYAYMAQDADSDVVVRNIVSGTEWRALRGYRPPAPPPDDSLPNFGEIIAAQARLARRKRLGGDSGRIDRARHVGLLADHRRTRSRRRQAQRLLACGPIFRRGPCGLLRGSHPELVVDGLGLEPSQRTQAVLIFCRKSAPVGPWYFLSVAGLLGRVGAQIASRPFRKALG